MLAVWIACTDHLLEVIYLLNRLNERATIDCSPAMLSFTVCHHSLDMVVAFQMTPPFFTRFFCHRRIHSTKVFLQQLFDIIKRMNQAKFSSMILLVNPIRNRLGLNFSTRGRKKQKLLRKMEVFYSMGMDAEEIDMGTFVSLDTQDFRRIVTEFNGFLVQVTVTNSHVKFSVGSNEIILTKEERQCVIGGVAEGKEVGIFISICPLHLFYNVAFRSERVWLFKTIIGLDSMIIAPVGLHAQFLIYLPRFNV